MIAAAAAAQKAAQHRQFHKELEALVGFVDQCILSFTDGTRGPDAIRLFEEDRFKDALIIRCTTFNQSPVIEAKRTGTLYRDDWKQAMGVLERVRPVVVRFQVNGVHIYPK